MLAGLCVFSVGFIELMFKVSLYSVQLKEFMLVKADTYSLCFDVFSTCLRLSGCDRYFR